MAANVEKKVVRVKHDAANPPEEPSWKPTPEAKGKATRLRLIAVLLWLVAIGLEAGAIFWVLDQEDVNMILLIGAIVLIGALSITGSILWKKANRADPAKRSEPFRFFVQNQLGAIIAIIAFLPLIIMIYTNKNMSSKDKNIAGIVGIVVALAAVYFGASFNSPSVEQYTAETARVVAITGQDLVFWTSQGNVYHLCEAASPLHLESSDPTIFSGTVGDAHAEGMDRLTLQVEMEMGQCGFDTVDPGENPEPVTEES
jgi:hypothetical protein